MSRKGITKAYHNFEVHVVPVLKDNYSYVVHCLKSNATALVDVAQFAPVAACLKHRKIPADGSSSVSVLSTHKHYDHTGGNADIAKAFPSWKIYGGKLDDIAHVTHKLDDGATFSVGELTVTVLHTPCHTKGHVLYHVYHPEDPEKGALFTGDTVFVGGIGAFFEGNAEGMVQALSKVSALPPLTDIYCGHEYTMGFFDFGKSFLPDDGTIRARAQQLQALRDQGLPTVPSTIADELRTNLFFRTADPVVQQKADGQTDPIKVMDHLYNACP